MSKVDCNLFNSPLFRTARMCQYQKNHSLISCLCAYYPKQYHVLGQCDIHDGQLQSVTCSLFNPRVQQCSQYRVLGQCDVHDGQLQSVTCFLFNPWVQQCSQYCVLGQCDVHDGRLQSVTCSLYNPWVLQCSFTSSLQVFFSSYTIHFIILRVSFFKCQHHLRN